VQRLQRELLKRRRDRQEFLDEGNKIRDQQARELMRLQAIKEAKIQELVKRFATRACLNVFLFLIFSAAVCLSITFLSSEARRFRYNRRCFRSFTTHVHIFTALLNFK
jgi:hypothetical protein